MTTCGKGTKTAAALATVCSFVFLNPVLAHGAHGGAGHGGGHSSGGHFHVSGLHYHYGHYHYGRSYGYGHRYWGGGAYYGGGYQDQYNGSNLPPYYPGSDSVIGRQLYNQNKVQEASSALSGDQTQLAQTQQEYQTFAARAAAYEQSLAEKMRNYRSVSESVENRLKKEHNPEELAKLRQWLQQEHNLEQEASRDIATEQAWLKREEQKMNNAAYNVSEDQEQIKDYAGMK